jgi:acyl-coenzyme A thioesterase PaaI-like protein
MLWFADVTATVLVLKGRDPTVGMTGFPVAINLNANFFANQGDGLFRARSEYVIRGRSVSVVRILVTADNDRPMAKVTTSYVAAA